MGRMCSRPGLVTDLQYKLGQMWLLFELVGSVIPNGKLGLFSTDAVVLLLKAGLDKSQRGVEKDIVPWLVWLSGLSIGL